MSPAERDGSSPGMGGLERAAAILGAFDGIGLDGGGGGGEHEGGEEDFHGRRRRGRPPFYAN